MVTPENFRQLSRGHVGDDVQRDGQYVKASIYIQDGCLADKVRRRERSDVSSAYVVEIEDAVGEYDGQAYDRIQRRIRGNHVAVVAPNAGRAGPEVRIRLDSRGNEIIDDGDDRDNRSDDLADGMEVPGMAIRYDGIDYDVTGAGARTLQQAVERGEAEHASIIAQRDEMQGRCDALGQEIKARDERIAQLSDQTRVDALVDERLRVISDARVILGKPDKDFAGQTTRQIMMKALGFDESRQDSSDDFVRGAFEARAAIVASERQGAPSESQIAMGMINVLANHSGETVSRMDEVDRSYRDRLCNAWRRKGDAS
jgi:hypothetical protein